jgi:S-methylmethionine-dependent homocysteine/selenocysteine methylase
MAHLLGDRLAGDGVLILDGAMGTEIRRREVDTGLPLWSAKALIVHPEVVSEIHRDYITAGADIITTDTFRTTRRSFGNARLPDRSGALTALAVRLAREAAAAFPERSVLVAGSIAPLEDCYRPDLVPSEREMVEEHREHATRLAGEGVDFLLLETMNTIREAAAACRAGVATGKEVVVSFICRPDGRLYSGETIEGAVSAVSPLGPSAISLNCISPHHIGEMVKHIRNLTDLPIAAYGNVGKPGKEREEEEFVLEVDEIAYAEHAAGWIRGGAAIIGGCCGTTPTYIRRLRQGIPQRHGDTE